MHGDRRAMAISATMVAAIAMLAFAGGASAKLTGRVCEI